MPPQFPKIVILAVCLASVSLADDFKTLSGKEYNNVTISRQAPDGITVAIAASPAVDVVSPLTGIFILVGIIAGLKIVFEQWLFDKQREKRRTYYRVTYLKSDNWKRKRALVLKRDRYLRLNVAAVPTSRGNWLTHKSAYGIEPERFVRRTTIPHKRAACSAASE